jgi:hypothetical protein
VGFSTLMECEARSIKHGGTCFTVIEPVLYFTSASLMFRRKNESWLARFAYPRHSSSVQGLLWCEVVVNLSYFAPNNGHAVAQAVSRQPFATKTGKAPGSVHVGIVVDKMALGQIFLRVFQFFPVSIIPPWPSILISSEWWTVGPFVAAVQRHSLTP